MNKNKTPVVKPFPRECPKCRERQVFSRTVSHSLNVDHDGRTHHITVKRLKTPFCTNCHCVIPDGAANRQITLEFLRQAKLLTPNEIRRQREQLGLTQKQLASILGIAEATMSRWETGGQIQQRSLDNLLRLFFDCHNVREKLNNRLPELGLELVLKPERPAEPRRYLDLKSPSMMEESSP